MRIDLRNPEHRQLLIDALARMYFVPKTDVEAKLHRKPAEWLRTISRIPAVWRTMNCDRSPRPLMMAGQRAK